MQRIKKGDVVSVIAGKSKGSRGKVLRILNKSDRVVIERVNMVKRHTKPTQTDQQGGIIEKEGTIHISNVMPVDPGSDKPTRVKVKIEDGKRMRVGLSGAVLEGEK